MGQDTTLPDMIHSHGHPDPLRLREGLGEMKDFHFVMIFREDPLDREMGTHSSNLAWRIPWTEEPGSLQSEESGMTEQLSLTYTIYYVPGTAFSVSHITSPVLPTAPLSERSLVRKQVQSGRMIYLRSHSS